MIQKMKNARRFFDEIPALAGRVLGMFSHPEPKMALRQTAVIIPPAGHQQSDSGAGTRGLLTIVALRRKVYNGNRGPDGNE
jgi:hypothetical protein